MTLFVKYDLDLLCKTLLKEQLDAQDISYSLGSLGEIHIEGKLSPEKQENLTAALKKYGIDILSKQKVSLIDRIKNAIDDYLRNEDFRTEKLSTYLSNKLHYSYAHLSTVFSENTYMSVENYTILKKIDLAKELICNTNLTLTEIAFRLDYSSVAHLSRQFKKTTGLTPSVFQSIMNKKKN
ncbi:MULTISPECIES: helix-turn-helix domain-containing protein [Xanthomarina]|jgi:AraC-like DNA-binding protein|uniref:AraC family transcriptional regulator n=1 Tax=Xanthomarina gelatinilytica TaxID=1137281 RepID=M7MYV4_9FLAO|nr:MULTISPECIES: AraC family transcriptional regulator [Xanthomarina]MCB0389046.1 helix-turn-helix transcriptional regulator [Winogradskyella sp.]EMQ94684.1 helix-turn-helix- domain containing protein, AraC type [Xanthomarina gelatinilytica]MAL22932.1 AraC family transcriptional regulator [Xanthomarina sp.]MBF62786.1 AraC family transcriptional regulator [Xanthomarina sp.]HAB28165.1 AraC family transcriptional regulator [Xanthomarina gelatinilytica]|tara:strand:+ start:1020 stop:1562 length:543 start_codon:yes stop_codon:yes gene_type:complete